MTILLYTDASTKNGYSCYAYRSSLDIKPTCGIVQTMNIAAMEVLAIVNGLSKLSNNSKVLVISDFKSAVSIILNHRKHRRIINSTGNYYRNMCKRLSLQCFRLNVDALWVCSKFPNERHLEVDQISKIILQEYLKGVK